MRKNKLDRQLLERKFKEARSAVLPDVNAGVNLDWYPLLPTQLLPGQLFGMADGTFVSTQFGRPWQLSGTITMEQPVLNESARRSIPALNVTRGISDMLLEKSNEDVIFNTATVFYQTLQMEQLLRALELKRTVFRSDHASNWLVLKGVLGAEKERLLQEVRNAIGRPEAAPLRAAWQRGL